MTLTTLIGALVALIPRANGDWLDRLEKLAARVDQLTRSQARLIDNIERLEREILTERQITAHWKAEAQRLARQSREHINGRNALAYAQQTTLAAAAQMPAQQTLQNHYTDSHGQVGHYAAQSASGGGLYAEGFCNCVPSRAQVWAATQGETCDGQANN